MRILFPSWELFAAPGVTTLLWAREQGANLPWRTVNFAKPRRWFHLFINPTGMVELAFQQAVRALIEDINETSDRDLANLERRSTFRVVEDGVRLFLDCKSTFQFKIEIRDGEVSQTALVSNWRSI